MDVVLKIGLPARTIPSRTSIVKNTTAGRWGTQLDLWVLAEYFDLNVHMIDLFSSATITEYTGQGRRFTVAYSKSHFVLVKTAPGRNASVQGRGRVVHGGAKSRAHTKLQSRASSSHQDQSTNIEGAQAGRNKRPYPFADMTEEEIQQIQVEARQQCQEREQQCKALLVSHGSFNPPHLGHIEMMKKARSRLISAGYEVEAGVMAIANRSWIWSKGDLSLEDSQRVAALEKLIADNGCADWLHADIRGTGFKSYWQMKPLLMQQYPGTIVFGIFGSDCGRVFPEGPGICVCRRGYSGPKENHTERQYTVEEEEAHSHSSTKLRQAIFRKEFDKVASMTGRSLLPMVKQWGLTMWHNKGVLEVEAAEAAARELKLQNRRAIASTDINDNPTRIVLPVNDVYHNSNEATRTTRAVDEVMIPAQTPQERTRKVALPQAQTTPAVEEVREAEPPRVLVPQEKAMPRRTAVARHKPVDNRPPLPRRRRPADHPTATDGAGEHDVPPTTEQAPEQPPEPEPAAPHIITTHLPDEFTFPIANFDSIQDAIDLVVEPALALYQRDLGEISIQGDGLMRVTLGASVTCATTVFITSQQARAQSYPLNRIAEYLNWTYLPGFLMSWYFAFLEVATVRDEVRDLLSRTMSLVRRQAVLSAPTVILIGIESRYHTFNIFTRADHTQDKVAMAGEIQWLANSFIASVKRDNFMHRMRVCLHHADWPTEYSDGSGNDDDNADNTGITTVVSGGGAATTTSSPSSSSTWRAWYNVVVYIASTIYIIVLADVVTSAIENDGCLSSLADIMIVLSRAYALELRTLGHERSVAIEWTLKHCYPSLLLIHLFGFALWVPSRFVSACARYHFLALHACTSVQCSSLMTSWYCIPRTLCHVSPR
eukprot:6460019-Amphidinium_carterae.2